MAFGSISRQEVKSYVLTMLGNSQVSVELQTPDWEQILQRTLDKYNSYRPKMVELPHTINSGVQDYQLDRDKIGRGVFDIVRKSDIGDTSFALFDSSYFPLNFGGYRLDTPHFLEWKTYHQGQREVYGTTFDFEWMSDTNVLRIYPPPTESEAVNLVTGHDRFWEEQELGKGDGSTKVFDDLQVTDPDGFSIGNVVPGVKIKTKNEIFRDKQNGVLVSTGGGAGTINYSTGEISVTFDVPPADKDPIIVELLEVRPHDKPWFQDYALALGKIVVGHKRAKFGSIPGQQASIELDTAIRDHGSEELKELEEKAKLWLIQYLVPRQQ